MPFRVVSGVGRGMGVLDEHGDRRRGMGSFGVNLVHPIIMGTLLHSCARAMRSSRITSGELVDSVTATRAVTTSATCRCCIRPI